MPSNKARPRIIYDINVLIDVATNREPFATVSGTALNYSLAGDAEGFVSAHAVTTLFYLVHRLSGSERAFETVRFALDYFSIVASDEELLNAAFAMAGSDFEDNVVVQAALRAQCDVIVSRDIAGFRLAEVGCIHPDDLPAWFKTNVV